MRIVRDDRSVRAGLTLRQAEPSDSRSLAALWRRVPAAGPAGLVWVEHSDWWAAVGAPEGREVIVAELDGRLVGASAFALLDARLDGRAIRLAVVGPWRVEPAGQGHGVFRALQAAAGEAIARVGAEALTLVPVAGPAHRLPRALRRWPDRYERLVLDCVETASDPAAARRAGVDDAEGLLKATCAGAVLAPADVGGRFRRRLVRDPRGYGSDRLLTNGEAIIGVAMPLDGSTASRYSDATTILDRIANNRVERY